MRKFKIAGVLRVFALILLVSLVWCAIRDRTSAGNWRVPLQYNSDGQQIMGWVKAASEGDYVPFGRADISRLGAPYQANWYDYPMYEKPLVFCLGLVAKVVGVFEACNVGVLLGHILSAVSFYLCCRFLKYAKTWSFVGAVLFSFTYYHFWRNLGHLLLAFSYTVPWAILSCWIIVGSKRLRLGDRFFWVCIVTALVMGLSNPYNLNLYLQLLLFSLVVQFLRRRRRENLQTGLLAVAVAGVAFLAINMGTFAFEWAHGKNPTGLERNYFESELYALKPIEFFIPPPTHNVEGLADIGNKYIASVFVKGEICSPYLGIIGIAGLLWMFSESFLLLVRNRKPDGLFPPYALQSSWIIFYAVIGGANCMIALGGIQLFRSTNRFSIFISALILLFLVSRLSVRSRQWPPVLKYGIAAAALMIGIYDETPRPMAPEETIASAKMVESDQEFGRKLEEKLPPKAMIYQLPVMVFPDGIVSHEMEGGYELLRPYFATKTLRFTFGSVRGRNREAWQWEVEKMPAAQMISTLEKYGFSSIYINRRGYEDHGEALLKQLAAEGRDQTIEDDVHQQVCVLLKPSANPELPHTDDRAQVIFKSGWSVKQRTPLENRSWSGGNATLAFFSEPKQAASYSFRCMVGSILPRRVSIVMNGQELWSSQVGANQAVPVDITVVGRRGNNTIELKTDAAPFHPKDSPLPFAFTLINVEITRLL
ncbi:MAG: hypothetical protein JWR19_2777 [Pedosphaera sp.]|nr:hypothetical protein [Pedosphaera sp.]